MVNLVHLKQNRRRYFHVGTLSAGKAMENQRSAKLQYLLLLIARFASLSNNTWLDSHSGPDLSPLCD
jgi:hypothetical protein